MRAELVEQTGVSDDAAVADETAVTLERPSGPPPRVPAETPPPERELWPWLLALLVLVLAGLAVLYFATNDDTSTQREVTTQTVGQRTVPASPSKPSWRALRARVTVPALVGLPARTALTRLRQLGLVGARHNVFSDKARNVVVAQTPGSARKLGEGETVVLTVSNGPKAVTISSVVGLTIAEALSTFRSQALAARIVRVPSVAPVGQVVAQHPQAGAKAPPRTAVRLNVSDGSKAAVAATTNQEAAPHKPAKASLAVAVPDLEGKKLIDARRLMRRVGLVIELRRVPNAAPLGIVISQAKKPGTRLKRGTHFLVTVSEGPTPRSTTPQSGSQPIAVPDVTGEDEISARQDLESAGLTVRVVDRGTSDASQDGVVIQQTPAANQSAQPNSTVTIYVGRYATG